MNIHEKITEKVAEEQTSATYCVSESAVVSDHMSSAVRARIDMFWRYRRALAAGLVGVIVLSMLFDVVISVKRSSAFNFVLARLGMNTGVVIDASSGGVDVTRLESAVLPADGVELPVVWRDIGQRMLAAGVIDQKKFEELYAQRGGMDEQMVQLLTGTDNGRLKITAQNSGYLLNLLWAFGLGNKNEVLEDGEMSDKQYGGAGNFASTGGWSLSTGDAMNHYSRHLFVSLTPEQQQLVDRVSRGIYRPCCGNSTHFPDCNHGMAMLGLLELMASQGVSEDQMYQAALAVNAYWFPNQALTIAKYLELNGNSWNKADPRELLGAKYFSSQGFRQISNEVTPVQQKSGGGCGA